MKPLKTGDLVTYSKDGFVRKARKNDPIVGVVNGTPIHGPICKVKTKDGTEYIIGLIMDTIIDVSIGDLNHEFNY